ncbi:hypothetical protein PENTCL1PPCAC_20975, partial [Pristionchus entomophagus]
TFQVDQMLLNLFNSDHPDNIHLANKRIFREMKISNYNRLWRVFQESKIDHIHESIALCEHADISQYINNTDDLVCVIEFRKLGIKEAYQLLQYIREIDMVEKSHQWSSILSMAYHYVKHEREFRRISNIECTPVDFFNKHAKIIFTSMNTFQEGKLFGQMGAERVSYYKVLNSRQTLLAFAGTNPSLERVAHSQFSVMKSNAPKV